MASLGHNELTMHFLNASELVFDMHTICPRHCYDTIEWDRKHRLSIYRGYLWYDSAHSTTITLIKFPSDSHSRMTPHTSPLRASYGMSFASSTKNNRDISRTCCIHRFARCFVVLCFIVVTSLDPVDSCDFLWRHDMETLSTWLVPLWGESTLHRWILL